LKHTIEKIQLKNGAVGLLIDVPEATVMTFDINFRAGDYLSPENKIDTAHLMEHMVLGANTRFARSKDFSKEFCKNGAYNNATTSTYYMSYIAECADFEYDRILDMLCLSVEAPLFLPSEFKSEKSNIREELRGLANNHFDKISMAVGEAMGQLDISYAKRAEQLDNITLKDVKDLYALSHTTGNMRFLIAGKLKDRKKVILSRIEKIALAKTNSRIELPNEVLKVVKKPIKRANKEVKNVYYRMDRSYGSYLPQRQDDATSALLGTLLGTLHSRIYGKARERGLVYSIRYGKYRTKDEHIWWLGGQVLPVNIEKLFRLIIAEFTSVANGKFSQIELNQTKQFALGNYQKGYQTVGQILEAYYEKFIFDDRIEEYAKVPDRIKALQRSDIIEAANKSLLSCVPWGLGFYGAVNKIDSDKLYHLIMNSLK
jgi:predicted Zn-dependent peptidase